ncbi:hypothetical protein STEG23_023828, partial [Scotinomys teguina]
MEHRIFVIQNREKSQVIKVSRVTGFCVVGLLGSVWKLQLQAGEPWLKTRRVSKPAFCFQEHVKEWKKRTR